MTTPAPETSYIVTSEVTVAASGAQTLEAAFLGRMKLVEAAPGFQRLEVWRDVREPGVYSMVSWWDSDDSFRSYMRSAEHHASHARVPKDPDKPRGTGVRRYELLTAPARPAQS